MSGGIFVVVDSYSRVWSLRCRWRMYRN